MDSCTKCFGMYVLYVVGMVGSVRGVCVCVWSLGTYTEYLFGGSTYCMDMHVDVHDGSLSGFLHG